MKDGLEQLRAFMVGRRIIAIEPPMASEAICKFVLDDGTAFRLHATDLGFWIEETEGDNGYSSLTGLLTDYYHYGYQSIGYDCDDAVIKVEMDANTNQPSIVHITAPDGKSFISYCAKFSDYEKKVLAHEAGIKILAKAANLGNAWMSLFSKHYSPDCPEDLLAR